MDELSDIFDQIERLPLTGHAKPLGYICIMWGWLEGSTDALLLTLMNMDDDRAAASVIYNMEQRAKLQALLAIGFVRKPNDEWYAKLKELVNHIDNDLRPERNRMVHDYWHPGQEQVLRVTNQAKVVREQARRLRLTFGSGKAVKVSDMYVLAFKILVAHGKMLTSIGEYHNAQQPSPAKSA